MVDLSSSVVHIERALYMGAGPANHRWALGVIDLYTISFLCSFYLLVKDGWTREDNGSVAAVSNRDFSMI